MTGRTIGTFFRDEVAQPLGADFHIGLRESDMAGDLRGVMLVLAAYESLAAI